MLRSVSFALVIALALFKVKISFSDGRNVQAKNGNFLRRSFACIKEIAEVQKGSVYEQRASHCAQTLHSCRLAPAAPACRVRKEVQSLILATVVRDTHLSHSWWEPVGRHTLARER